MNQKFATKQALKPTVRQPTAPDILFEAASDEQYQRHQTLEQRREPEEIFQTGAIAILDRGAGGPLHRNRTQQAERAGIVGVSGLGERAEDLAPEIRGLADTDWGELEETPPSIRQPETPSQRQGPIGITGYTSDINQQLVKVKDAADMCANSETHAGRGRPGSGGSSPTGNDREAALQVPSPRGRGARAMGGSMNGENLFRQSDAGSASISASRATFPEVRLGLGSGGERGNVLVAQAIPQSQLSAGQAQSPSGNAVRAAPPQPHGAMPLDKLNFEHLGKILYGLLQQIELVKFLLASDAGTGPQQFWTLDSPEQASWMLGQQQWQQAGQRLVNTIMRSQDGSASAAQNRAQIHSIESRSVKEIFLMLNNFAVMYLKSQDSPNANVILQCAAQIYQSYSEIKSSSSLASLLYSNLSLYHLSLSCSNPRASGEDDERASKYMDGAIIANKRTEEELAHDAQNERLAPPQKANPGISLAISYNNKAVIELKRKNFESSKQFSLRTVEMIEPRVFGMVQAELVSRVNQAGQVTQQDHNQQIFQELLQVLLIGYFNLAMSQDRELSSRALYLKGMQLCFQYMPGGRSNYLFKKFEKKYTRKMYAVLEAKRNAPAQLLDLDPHQDLPDILPLNVEAAIQASEGGRSQISPNFQENLNLGARRAPVQLQHRPQNQGDERSFTMLDSERQSALGGNAPQRILLRGEESVASMPNFQVPCITYGLSASNGKEANDRAARNEASRGPQAAGLRKPLPQNALHPLHSETVQPAVRRNLAGEREQRGVLAALGGASSPLGGNPSQGEAPANSSKGSTRQRHMPADGRVQELVRSGEGLENRGLGPPQLSKKFDARGLESEVPIPLRIGPQQTQPTNPGPGLAPQENEANGHLLRLGTMHERQAQLPQIKEACKESAEESRALSLGQRETLTTPKNRFSKITNENKTYAEDYSQGGDTPFLPNPEARPRSNTLGMGDESRQKSNVPEKESERQSQPNAARGASLQTPLFCNAASNEIENSNSLKESPPVRSNGEELRNKEDRQRQIVESQKAELLRKQQEDLRVADAVRDRELAMQRQFDEKMAAMRWEHTQEMEALRVAEESKQEPQDFSAALPKNPVPPAQDAKSGAPEKTEAGGRPLGTILETESPPAGRSQGSPALPLPQKAALPKPDLHTEVPWSPPVETSLDEGKKESTVMSFEGAKRASGPQPGLPDYSEFARPADELEKAEWRQRRSQDNEEPGDERNDQGFQQAHVAGINNKIEKSKIMELWVTKETARCGLAGGTQQRRASQGSSLEGSRSAIVGSGGNMPDDGAPKPVLSPGTDRDNGRQLSYGNQTPDQALNSKRDARSGNQQFFLSLDRFIKDFNEADEDQFIKNLADLRSKCFNEESIQWKFLLNLREHYRLFRPQNIWRFQLRFLQQIQKRKTISCSKIVPQVEVTDTSITVKRYFKVTVEVVLENEPGRSPVSLSDILRQSLGSELQSLLEDRIQLTLSAEPEASDDEAMQLQVPKESLSMLLLQTLLYKFSHLEAIDPCAARSCESYPGSPTSDAHSLMGSTPFYHLETFEDLCQHVVYPFVEISSPDQGWTSRRRSVDSQAQSARGQARAGAASSDQLNIEFCDIPQGLFIEPLMIAFLLSPDHAGAAGDNEMDQADSNANSFTDAPGRAPLSQNCQTQGGGSPSTPQAVGNRQVASSKVNCQIDVHHIQAKSFKLTIKPIFHTQTFVLQKMLSKMDPSQMSSEDAKHWSEIQQNNDLLLNLQPNNTNNLIIDLELQETASGPGKTPVPAPNYFEEISRTKFSAQRQENDFCIESFSTIEDTKGFFEKYLKRFIDALQELLKKEFKEFFEQQGPNELLNQDLLSLIIEQKVVYCSLGIKGKGSTGIDKAQKPNHDEMYVVLRGSNGSSQDDLKVVCLLAESGTNNPVRAALQAQETKVSILCETFGQALDQSSTLQGHYILANLCKLHLKTVSWEFAKPENDSESEGSLNVDGSDSLSESGSDDDSGGEEGGASKAVPTLVTKEVSHMCTQRRVVVQEGGPVAVTFALLGTAGRMLGVRAVALNATTLRESGVYFQLDQMKWKEDMKKYKEVTQSVLKHLQTFGFDYLLQNWLNVVPHKAGGYDLVLKDERMPTLEGYAETNPKDCTITQLEKYIRPEKIYQILKEQDRSPNV